MSTGDAPAGDGVVVAGFDGSDEARRAVRWAAGEAQQWQRDLLIVHAFEWRPPAVPYDWTLSDKLRENAFREHNSQRLADLAEGCRHSAANLTVSTAQRDGPASVALGDIADEADAHAIVIGSTGLGAIPRMLLGSTAAELVRATHRPVIVVRGKQDTEPTASPLNDIPVVPVVVGVDSSPTSQPAIGFAFEFAARHDCAVHAVHAWHDPELDVVVPAPLSGASRDQMHVLATDIAEQHLAGWARRCPRVPVHLECVADRPAQALLERAENARLLVVGSHGHGTLRRALLGSVSHAALHHAPCPVAVIRAPQSMG